MTKKWDGKIPWKKREDGRWFVPDYANERHRDVEWRDNEPFEDVLTFAGFSRGRSAARMVFKSRKLGVRVEMMLTHFSEVAKRMVAGQLQGQFKFAKRGTNFGICMLPEEETARPLGDSDIYDLLNNWDNGNRQDVAQELLARGPQSLVEFALEVEASQGDGLTLSKIVGG